MLEQSTDNEMTTIARYLAALSLWLEMCRRGTAGVMVSVVRSVKLTVQALALRAAHLIAEVLHPPMERRGWQSVECYRRYLMGFIALATSMTTVCQSQRQLARNDISRIDVKGINSQISLDTLSIKILQQRLAAVSTLWSTTRTHSGALESREQIQR